MNDEQPTPALASEMGLRRTGLWLLILGAVALWASADLAVERYLALIDPLYVPSCSLSVFVDCSPAMGSWQGALFGFPNPYLGVLAFPVVMTTGVVMISRWEPPRWYWRTLTIVTTAAVGLIVFLMYTSVHSLERLCPFCMVVWIAMIPLWWQMVSFGIDRGHIPAPQRLRTVAVTYRSFVILGIYVAVILWIVVGLWDLLLIEVQG